MSATTQAKLIVDALLGVKGNDPTTEEVERIALAALVPILEGVDSLARIAAALESIAEVSRNKVGRV